VGALSERLYARQIELGDTIRTIVKRAQDAAHPLDRATVYKYLQGKGAARPPEHTIRGLAAGFELSEAEIRRLLDMPSGDAGPWQPPEEAARLSRDQRRALDTLIKAIVKPIDAVTKMESHVVTDESHNKSSYDVAAALEVGEDGATRPRRTPGPGSRRRTPKKVNKNADAPRDTDRDPAL